MPCADASKRRVYIDSIDESSVLAGARDFRITAALARQDTIEPGQICKPGKKLRCRMYTSGAEREFA